LGLIRGARASPSRMAVGCWLINFLTRRPGIFGAYRPHCFPLWRGRRHTNRHFPYLVSELNPFIRCGRSLKWPIRSTASQVGW
jgi:hypothetical protein